MAPQNPIEPEEITILVLAGGRGSRMGGRDKGLLSMAGKPVIEHVLERIRLQSRNIIISANRNIERYAGYGYPVIRDATSDFPGPLAGVLSGLIACPTAYLLAVPVDTPLVHRDFSTRMRSSMAETSSPACVAECDGKLEPLFCLLKRSLQDSLRAYLNGGHRSARGWMQQIDAQSVDCSDMPDQFINLNRECDLAKLETMIEPGKRNR